MYTLYHADVNLMYNEALSKKNDIEFYVKHEYQRTDADCNCIPFTSLQTKRGANDYHPSSHHVTVVKCIILRTIF